MLQVTQHTARVLGYGHYQGLPSLPRATGLMSLNLISPSDKWD